MGTTLAGSGRSRRASARRWVRARASAARNRESGMIRPEGEGAEVGCRAELVAVLGLTACTGWVLILALALTLLGFLAVRVFLGARGFFGLRGLRATFPLGTDPGLRALRHCAVCV